MYGKIFSSMFDGSLYGNWQAIITLQQMIVLCDIDGVVDMTPQAIAARTSIPLEHIQAGIEILEQPDKYSRTPDADGRRIERLDEHRPWGWRIINYKKYRHLVDSETVREQNRERQRRHRSSRSVTDVNNNVTSSNSESRYAEAEVEVDVKNKTTLSGSPPDTHPPAKLNGHTNTARSLLVFLNEKTGRNYQPVKANLDMIVARLKEGATERQCRLVILRKFHDWGNDEKMTEYLRPATLFNRTKFAQYVGEIPKEQTNA